jgi:hypothetical protein
MSKLRRRTVALLGASVLAGSALIASPADAATRASASAAVLKMPKTVQANSATAEATVSYKCTNDATAIYYIIATLSQEGNLYYKRGHTTGRVDFDPLGRLPATCTGKKVTETIVLYSSGRGIPEGSASFEFVLFSLAPPPGSYYGQPGTGAEDSKTRPVKVETSSMVMVS